MLRFHVRFTSCSYGAQSPNFSIVDSRSKIVAGAPFVCTIYAGLTFHRTGSKCQIGLLSRSVTLVLPESHLFKNSEIPPCSPN